MWTKIAEGNSAASLKMLSVHEGEMGEGDRGKLVLNFKVKVLSSDVNALRVGLKTAKVTDATVESSSQSITIGFRKAFAWLPVVLLIILGIVILAINIMGWVFFKEIAAVIPAPIVAIGAVVLIIVVLFTLWKTKGINIGSPKLRGSV